jgi:hypothetical protein
MTHWKKLTNPNYLGSYAFQPGEEKPLTIRNICTEEVTNPNEPERKETCVVAHFQQQEKPLILNKTNLKAIERLAGTPNVEEWEGVGIILCVQKVRAFGELVDGVRIRPVKPFVCADCGGIITGYGGKSHAEIREYTKNTYKRQLCAACATRAKNAGEAKKAAVPAEDQEPDQQPVQQPDQEHTAPDRQQPETVSAEGQPHRRRRSAAATA